MSKRKPKEQNDDSDEKIAAELYRLDQAEKLLESLGYEIQPDGTWERPRDKKK